MKFSKEINNINNTNKQTEKEIIKKVENLIKNFPIREIITNGDKFIINKNNITIIIEEYSEDTVLPYQNLYILYKDIKISTFSKVAMDRYEKYLSIYDKLEKNKQLQEMLEIL